METKPTTDPKFIYYHSKHQVVQVTERSHVTITKTQPLNVTYTKVGRIIEDIDFVDESTLDKIKVRTYFEDAPRISFAGKIVHQTPENVEIHIGVAMTKGANYFSRRKGRDIAKSRANNCPVIIIYCLTSEIAGVFHKAVEKLIPVIKDTEQTMCLTDPLREVMSLESILNEETPD